MIDKLGLPGIFALMVAESACIPIPSEATMLFAGFNVADGDYSLLAVVAVGMAANLVGSWIAYAIGYYGRIDMLEKHGSEAAHQAVAPRLGRPLVRALRLGDRLLLAHAADHPHVHLAAGGRRADAVLALHGADRRSAASRGSSCSRSSASRSATTGRAGRTPCTTSTTRCAALIVLGDRLPGRAQPPRRAAAAEPAADAPR